MLRTSTLPILVCAFVAAFPPTVHSPISSLTFSEIQSTTRKKQRMARSIASYTSAHFVQHMRGYSSYEEATVVVPVTVRGNAKIFGTTASFASQKFAGTYGNLGKSVYSES